MSTSSLPSAGSFPVDTSTLFGPGAGKKGKSKDEVVSFRYAFKPASITSATPAVLTTESGSRRLVYEMQNGSRQVFDVREETSKPRECVLIYNEVDQTFSLRALPTTLHLTLNRSLSTATKPPGPPSIASSSSSGSVPLSKRKHTAISESSTAKVEAESESARRPKKARPSQARPAAPTPQKVSRKTLPTPTTTTATSTTSKAKESKAAGGGKKAQPKQPVGKYKSAEIIEDSDEEAGDLTTMDKDKDKGEVGDGGVGVGGDGDEVEEEEEEDDFARLLGDEMAADEAAADDDDDSDDEGEEEDEDEEDMGLGGARYISRKQTAPQDDLNGDSEWL